MAGHDSKLERWRAHGDQFATTHWSMVVSAGGPRSSEASRALAVLCENYWFPLYAFVRRAGYSAEDAQDLTQEFFVRLLTKNYLATADRQRGRFRSFLLGAMKHFLANQERRQGAQKRGGGQTGISLDFHSGEDRYRQIEPADRLTPERLYEKRWAMTLLDLVLSRLRDEFQAAGKSELFDTLKQFLAGGTAKPAYLAVAGQLGMSEGAVKVAVHRLRRRYRKLLEEEIARTIAGPESLEDELRELLAALGSDE
jgi:RNA polymerase sigma-70 factor (ECF subfamily)